MQENDLNKLHILIAEDDEDDAETIKQAFEKHSHFYKVDVVKDGKELLNFLNENHSQLPHVILTDLNMPLKNGYEALMDISKDKMINSIPVFVYSTTVNPIYVLQCKELGAKDFLIKPFNLSHFDLIPDKILSVLMEFKGL